MHSHRHTHTHTVRTKFGEAQVGMVACGERDPMHSKVSKLMPRIEKKLETAEKSLSQAQTLLDDLITFYGKGTPDVDVSMIIWLDL